MLSRERVVDEMLVLAAQCGRVEAFERLVTRWHPRLLRYAWRRTGDPEGARETVQEAWMAVAGGLGRLKDPTCFASWVFRIVNRRCADWIRCRTLTRQRIAPLNAALQTAAPSGEQSPLREAVRRLDPDMRTLLEMFYMEGLSVAEIAGILNIPAGTVKSRLFSARERLRASMEV